ncbi:MAG: hypothetical protein U9Q95_02475 [Candidatus Eisenbacteria bacterium]|nr:hypothetical protein [Candidatus Eisenbacteria bacterium]
MKAMSAVLVLAIAAVLLVTATASGQVPEKMNYQVMLTDNSDQPLADQAVTLVFRIYNSDIGGAMLWTETHATATNSIGVVSVVLGTTTPLSANSFIQPLWIEVQVDGQTLTPRRELTASPYAIHAYDADRLGLIAAEDYALEEDLGTPGSINNPSNPVDWTMLKNVPAGFADGADDVGGAGDGHSLDASDGSPVDAVYVDASGNVGIGTTAPANKLTVGGSSASAYAQFTSSSTGYTASDGFEIGINGSGYAFINQQEAHSISFMTGATARAKLTSDGIFEFGSSASDGVAEFYAAGGASPSIYLNSNHGDGGELELYEENGTRYGFLEPDVSGTGGYLHIMDGDGGYDGFYVDGNSTGGDAYVGIEGSGSSTGFNTNATGDDAVDLPTSAVAAVEILDEAGAASNSGYLLIELTGPIQTLLSRSIWIPAPGYVLVTATAEAVADHVTGTTSGCNFGVSNSSSGMVLGGEMYIRIPNNAGSGLWYPGVTAQWMFEVASVGTHTFYFLGDEVVGDWVVYDRNLTLVYIPSSYGGIGSTVAAPPSNPEETTVEAGHALTEADIAAERAESEAFNSARIERELAEMEAKIAEMRASMGNGNTQ